jgi:hypothetical protein
VKTIMKKTNVVGSIGAYPLKTLGAIRWRPVTPA